MKTCANCKQLLPTDAFGRASRRRDGLACSCKVCTKKLLNDRIETGRYNSEAIVYAQTHTSRTCTKCHRDLPLSSFYADKRLKSGLYTYCKECMAKASADYRKTPRGKASAVAISLRYQATDRGKEMVEKWVNSDNGKASAKKKGRKYRQSKKGRAAMKRMQQSQSYKDTMARYMKTEKGRAKIARCRHQRKSRTKSLPCTLTGAEWSDIKATYKHKCVYCGENKPLTMDHIIPLSKGGTLTKNNIVPACVSCNSIKGNRPVLLQLLVI